MLLRVIYRFAAKKKQRNKEYSTALLVKRGIKFESRNEGLHLMIETSIGRVNFYPSTGLYNGALQGRGVKNLLKTLKLIGEIENTPVCRMRI